MNRDIKVEPSSYRDPAGFVFFMDGNVHRAVKKDRWEITQDFLNSQIYQNYTKRNKLVKTGLSIDIPKLSDYKILRHEIVPFISYPYEWSFSSLKAAALLHLDLQIESLKENFMIKDGSSYNIQFVGPTPIFIDLLSFEKYKDGMFWTGQNQFNMHFLNPLIFSSTFSIGFNNWLRSSIEGIETDDLIELLPFYKKCSPQIFANLILPSMLQKKLSSNTHAINHAKSNGLKKRNLIYLLENYKSFILSINKKKSRTIWDDYYDYTNNYDLEDTQKKHQVISEFVTKFKPKTLWDIGCNTGEFSETSILAGAEMVIGFDFDQSVIENAFQRASSKKLNFLPLYQDLSNPSPGNGWLGEERQSLSSRKNADAFIALAVIHHLIIGKNIPQKQVLQWLCSLAPNGVIEFIPKNDSNLKKLLKNREDIFSDYEESIFRSHLESVANILRVDQTSKSGRKLFWISRK